MNRQEIVDKVLPALWKQGGKSREVAADMPHAQCLYRGPEGRRCAVGWLIPDEEYYSGLEGQPVRNLTLQRILGKVGIDWGLCGSMLINMQQTHDKMPDVYWDDKKLFLEEWKYLEECYGVTLPELE